MAITYGKILYCTDFSEEADYAREIALDLAERHQARLHCLHVLPSAYRFFSAAGEPSVTEAVSSPVSPEVMGKAQARLKEFFKDKLKGIKGEAVFEVRWGVPFVEIVRYARDRQVDCIVLGATGSSKIRSIVYGSTAENVARRAHCTVIITRDPGKGY